VRWVCVGSALRGTVRGASIDPWAALVVFGAVVALSGLWVAVKLWREARRSAKSNGAR
jgi:hypothetical protein